MANIVVKKSATLSGRYDSRYVVVDKDTGEILDDAQGYGYKTPQNAYAAYNYKNRGTAQKNKEKEIKKWIKEHKGFVNAMEEYAFEIAKGSWGPDEEFNTAFVKKMLKDYDLETNFTAAELLRVWKRS